jgi:hypothetical protein
LRFALDTEGTHVGLLQGPPGTGKTHTAVEVVAFLLRDMVNKQSEEAEAARVAMAAPPTSRPAAEATTDNKENEAGKMLKEQILVTAYAPRQSACVSYTVSERCFAAGGWTEMWGWPLALDRLT